MMNMIISKPDQGANKLPVLPGRAVVFDFDLVGVSFERMGDDLVIIFDQGHRTTLTDFFVADDSGALSSVWFMDGKHLSGDEFLRLVENGEDIAVAIGYAADVLALSGGIGAYQDGPGDIISGIDRLGALDTFRYQSESIASADMFSHASEDSFSVLGEPEISAGGGGIPQAHSGGPVQPKAPDGPGRPSEPKEPEGPSKPKEPENPSEPKEPEIPAAPYIYVKAALLGADTVDDPVVTVNLLNADGSRMGAPYPASVEVSGTTSYAAAYDSATGNLAISLKDPSAGAAPTENLTVVTGGKSYIVQVGSSVTNNLADVIWAPVDKGVAFTEETWAGSVNNHLQGGSHFVAGQASGPTVVTPDGYENKALHLQLRNSSLTARDDVPGAESASVDLKLKDGSFLISNEGHAVFDTHHADPVTSIGYEGMYWGTDQYDTSSTVYDATIVSALSSKGEKAVNAVSVTGGEAFIHAGGPAPDAGDADAVNIGAVYAAEGGTNSVSADTINVSASSDGFASKGYATVSGARADGAVAEEDGENSVRKHSEISLKAQGEISVDTAVTGDTESQDHQGITYAGVAATERGQVSLEGDGVFVNVTNQTQGDSLSTSGVYGIFSGAGFGAKDLPPLENFRKDGASGDDWADRNKDGLDEYVFDNYYSSIAVRYLMDKQPVWDDEVSASVRKSDQTRVSVNSGGDVDVKMDLGSGDYSGDASGISAVAGDVNVTAKGSINVDVVHAGMTDGNLSAASLARGCINMQAQENVDLAVSGNGTDVSVVTYHPFESYEAGYSQSPTHFSGTNVTLRGESGYGGGADNSVTGIDAAYSNFKGEGFSIHADEKASIDVTAVHNGGNTSSTGIAVGLAEEYWRQYNHTLKVGVDAPEFEISATVTGDVSTGNSTATGVVATNGSNVGLMSYASLEEFAETSYDLYEGRIFKPLEKLTVSVQGARHNAGIKAFTDGSDSEDRVLMDVRASELNVAVTGGAPSGTSGEFSSYGLLALYGLPESAEDSIPKIYVETADMTVTVDDAQHSVGLSAQGAEAEVTVTSVAEYDSNYLYTSSTPLNVTITATVTNASEQLRGIALEALEGGHVQIQTHQDPRDQRAGLDDTILLNGDIVLRNDAYTEGGDLSHIAVKTGAGNDSMTVNGGIQQGNGSLLEISMGEGEDSFALNGGFFAQGGVATSGIDMGEGADTISFAGGISLKDGAILSVDAGFGDDVLHLNGKMDISGGAFEMTGGAGNDVLILEAPDLATFEAWYKDWLELPYTLSELDCETITVRGLSSTDDLSWLAAKVDAAGGIVLDVEASLGAAPGAGFLALSNLSGMDDVDGLFVSAAAPTEGFDLSGPGEAASFTATDYTVNDNGAEEQLYIQLMTSNS